MSYGDLRFCEALICTEWKFGVGGGRRDEIRDPVGFMMAVVAQKNHLRILERQPGESKRSCVYIHMRTRIKELARHFLAGVYGSMDAPKKGRVRDAPLVCVTWLASWQVGAQQAAPLPRKTTRRFAYKTTCLRTSWPGSVLGRLSVCPRGRPWIPVLAWRSGGQWVRGLSTLAA